MAKPKDKTSEPAQPAPEVDEAKAGVSATGDATAAAVVAPPPSTTAAATPAEPKDKTSEPAQSAPRFRVRGLGTLRLNGEVYRGGEELALTEAEVVALNCPAIERF